MTRTPSPLRLLLLLAATGLLASCSDRPDPVGLDTDMLVTSMQQVPDVSGDYILAVSNGQAGRVARAVAELGGTVVSSHAGAGVLFASGLSDHAASTLAESRGVQSMMADLMIEGPGQADLVSEAMDGAAHDPTQAFFYQLGQQWDMQIIDADDAWTQGASAGGVTVAILDSGIDPYHQDLAGLVDAPRSAAFVSNANPLLPPWADDHYHGTHVAGTVASNGLGTAGVAPHATLMAVKVCGAFFGCPFSAILQGILHSVDHDADVINMSLGGFYNRAVQGNGEFHGFFSRVMNYASGNGVTVVSAAGNNGLDLAHLGRDFGAGSFVPAPCGIGDGLCVGATNVLDELAAYSNHGRSAVDLTAPGGDGLFPILAPCASTSVYLPAVAGFSCSAASYLWLAGTSMAAPHVAGAAALLAAQGHNPGQIKSILERTADDLGKRGADALFAKGRLNVLGAWSN